MQLTSGKVHKAQRVVIYGPEGIGKSTLANQFPKAVFIDAEGSTNWMDIQRFTCGTWQDILDAVKQLGTKNNSGGFKTVVIDTADWAERFCVTHICQNSNKTSIEDFGYGKGYTFIAEEFGRLLSSLNDLIDSGMHVIFIAHCTVKKMELPDEAGSFDHYELKCSRQTSPLLKEWAEAVLFVNYKVTVTQDDNKRTKAVGGRKRIIHTQHTAAYDAKNRWGLPDQIPFELPFDFGVFAKILGKNVSKPVVDKPAAPESTGRPAVDNMLKTGQAVATTPVTSAPAPTHGPAPTDDIPRQLGALMELSGVLASELVTYCEGKNFIPKEGMLKDIKRVVLDQMIKDANWTKVVNAIKTNRK